MVYSDLGGGDNGYLGLILSPYKYNIISFMPFIHPLHPGILVIPNGTTQFIVTAIQTQHK